jgi:hypothetical protein
MKRLWVIECKFADGTWDICDFTEYRFAFTSYHMAHKTKKFIQQFLQTYGSKTWYKNTFRVIEYSNGMPNRS